MPPRLEDGLRDDRVPGDPGRSGAEGRTPARDHPADLDAGRRPGTRNVAAGLAGAAQAGGPQEGATARHVPALPAVTLSHAEGHGERAHCRRSGGKSQSADMPSEPHPNGRYLVTCRARDRRCGAELGVLRWQSRPLEAVCAVLFIAAST